jgi:hypothetical protein
MFYDIHIHVVGMLIFYILCQFNEIKNILLDHDASFHFGEKRLHQLCTFVIRIRH